MAKGLKKQISWACELVLQQLERATTGHHRDCLPLLANTERTHADEVFVLEPFPNASFGGTICLTLQLRKHMQGKEEESSKQGIPSKFPVLSKRNKHVSDTEKRPMVNWGVVHSPTPELASAVNHCVRCVLVGGSSNSWCPQSHKTACWVLACLSPKAREFEGIQKPYKNSAGATNLNNSFPSHLQLSQGSHVSVCPKTLCFKGILEPLTCLGENGSNSYKAAFVGSSSQHTAVSVAEAMPACNSAVGCII